MIASFRSGPLCIEVTRSNSLLIAGVPNDDVAQAFFEVFARSRQAEDCHDFGSHDDVKTVFARETVARPPKRDHGGAQRAVIHIHDTAPHNAARIKAKAVAVVNMVVHERGQQIVGQRNGVEVAGKVQVDVLHRHHLGVAAASSATFHAKDGA